MVFHPVTNTLTRWNDTLEKGTEKIVHATQCCLPDKAHNLLTEKLLTEAKLVTHLFLTTIWLNLTLANPLLPPIAQYCLGASALIVQGPLIRYTKDHIKKLSDLSCTKKICAVVAPILIGVGVLALLYKFGVFASPLSQMEITLMSSEGFLGLAICSLTINVAITWPSRTDESPEVEDSEDILDCDTGLPVEQQARRDSVQLDLDIRELENQIRKMDRLIQTHPDLAQMCQEILDDGYRGAYAGYEPPDTSHLDPDNPIDQRTLRTLEKSKIESELEERQLFLQRHPAVAERVQEILSEQSQTPTGKTPLLIRV